MQGKRRRVSTSHLSCHHSPSLDAHARRPESLDDVDANENQALVFQDWTDGIANFFFTAGEVCFLRLGADMHVGSCFARRRYA